VKLDESWIRLVLLLDLFDDCEACPSMRLDGVVVPLPKELSRVFQIDLRVFIHGLRLDVGG
jgi:hypothetical protein